MPEYDVRLHLTSIHDMENIDAEDEASAKGYAVEQFYRMLESGTWEPDIVNATVTNRRPLPGEGP